MLEMRKRHVEGLDLGNQGSYTEYSKVIPCIPLVESSSTLASCSTFDSESLTGGERSAPIRF